MGMSDCKGELAASINLLFVKQAGNLLKAPGKSIPSNLTGVLFFGKQDGQSDRGFVCREIQFNTN